MAGAGLTLHSAADDLGYVERLLDAEGLPTADVREQPEAFYLAAVDGTRVGTGGLERAGEAGLLRSVVIEPDHRGQGLGRALCAALERTAQADGVDELYLLTETAAGFFAERGYREVERESAPPGIRATAEFSELCGDSAACMRKSL